MPKSNLREFSPSAQCPPRDSDLISASAAACPCPCPPAVAPAPAAPAARTVPFGLRDSHFAFLHSACPGSSRSSACHVHRFPDRKTHHDAGGDGDGALSVRLPRWLRTEIRSEEHTSELQ